jgi:hypothetical protein
LSHQLVARLGLSCLCVIQGVAQIAIDSGRTHARNPEWARHARFHVVWQSLTVGMLSVIELALIWRSGSFAVLGFYLAVLLAGVSPLGFVGALILRKRYDGALSDPNGIPPVPLDWRGRTILVDLNSVAVYSALLTLGIILILFKL